jgi:hypothetical protein
MINFIHEHFTISIIVIYIYSLFFWTMWEELGKITDEKWMQLIRFFTSIVWPLVVLQILANKFTEWLWE